jgi:hypothetical protein
MKSAVSTRRELLKNASATAAGLGLGDALLGRVPRVTAAEAQLDPKRMRLDSGVEPLVRLLEETPGDKLFDEIGGRIQKGLAYPELLTALFLAGVRNIRPYSQGHFHAVLMIHSAHQASLAAPDGDRWLPIFWALDAYKRGQAANLKEARPWRLEPVNEAQVPPAHKARQAFLDALATGDAAAADTAVVGLVRGAGAGEMFDAFAIHGARAFAWWIGHPAIFVSNGWRTLECIGWQHAEPTLRALAHLVAGAAASSPAPQANADQLLWKTNRELAGKMPVEWAEGKATKEATSDLLAMMRDASPVESSQKTVETLTAGVGPQSVWDAAFVGAAELMLRKPAGFVPLHAATTLNALRYAYSNSTQDETRRFLLLQAAAIVPTFRDNLKRRDGKVAETRLDTLEPKPIKNATEAAAEVFDDVGKDRTLAARKALTLLKEPGGARDVIDTARRLAFLKGNDSHDLKFTSAVFEDYANVSPAWRDRYLAGCLHIFRGSGDADNGLAGRTRAALKA